MTKLIPNDLNTYSPYGEVVIVRLKNNPWNYTSPFFYVVRREQINKSRNSNEFKDIFTETAGEEWSYWNIDEIDSWMFCEDLNKIWNNE